MGGLDTTMEEWGAVDMKILQFRLLTKWMRGTILLLQTKKYFGKISFNATYIEKVICDMYENYAFFCHQELVQDIC